MGLDPWALIEGIDPRVDGKAFDVWFASGQCKTVGQDAVMYLAAKDAERLPDYRSSAWLRKYAGGY